MSKPTQTLDQETFNQLKETISILVKEQVERLGDTSSKLTEKASHAKKAVGETVKKKPYSALFVSFLAGAALAFICKHK